MLRTKSQPERPAHRAPTVPDPGPHETEFESQMRRLTVLGIVVAGAVSITVGQGPFTLWSTILGLVLLAVLFANGRPSGRSWTQCIVFGTVFAFCLLLVAGVALNYLPGRDTLGDQKTPGMAFNPLNPTDLQALGFWVACSTGITVFVRFREQMRSH